MKFAPQPTSSCSEKEIRSFIAKCLIEERAELKRRGEYAQLGVYASLRRLSVKFVEITSAHLTENWMASIWCEVEHFCKHRFQQEFLIG
jgi:hypothetical protein